MTVRNLSYMLQPASIALIGGAPGPSGLDTVVARNLRSGGFTGEIYCVNSEVEPVDGIPTRPDIESLPGVPDLAVLTVAPDSIPGTIARLAGLGTKAALVITPWLCSDSGWNGQRLRSEMLEAAKPRLLRIAGPNSVGVIVPAAGLNASFCHVQALKGNLAFVTQSGSVLTAVLDWATSRNIGFSHLVSLGAMIDVDFGDMLDYLANDPTAEAILLYMESVTHARKFMSAARLAARMKPVIVLKAGRRYEGACASKLHTGTTSGADAVYDAAFRRAGMLRVYTIQELFDAVATLGFARTSLRSIERLAILTNGGGIGVLATDSLMDEGGHLAELTVDSMAKLDALLPPGWSRANPVDILGDGTPDRYAEALRVLLDDKGVDAVLVLNCPNAVVSGTETAQAVIDTIRKRSPKEKPHRVITSWLGDRSAQTARQLFAEHGVPTYETPDDAVRGFMQLVRWRQNQEMSIQIPPTIPDIISPDQERVRRIAGRALAEERAWLLESEVADILEAYGIRVDSTREDNHGLFIGMTVDEQFGPVIQFGQGGGPVLGADEDRATTIPPLNMHLAREVILRTRIGRLMEECSVAGGVDRFALTLVKVSQLVCDVDEIAEIEINRLPAVEKGGAALDARIRVLWQAGLTGRKRLAVRPYPKEMEQTIPLPDGQTFLLRPVLPEDEPAYHKLFAALSQEEVFMRFMSPMRALPRSLAVRLTHIDYDREMALVLVGMREVGERELYGGVRIHADSDNERAEFAILLRRDVTGMGLGPMLMRRIIDYARDRGIGEIFGEVLSENEPMLRLCQALGFKLERDPDDPGIRHVTLKLSSEGSRADP
jgi:acetyltransferase